MNKTSNKTAKTVIAIAFIFSIIGFLVSGENQVFRRSDTGHVALYLFFPLCPILFIYFLFTLKKSKSPWIKIFTSLFSAFSLSAISVFAFTGPFYLLNVVWDKGPIQTHNILVTKMEFAQTRYGPAYRIYFNDWKPPYETCAIEVTKEYFGTHREGEKIDIQTKPGFFGAEWLVSPLATHN